MKKVLIIALFLITFFPLASFAQEFDADPNEPGMQTEQNVVVVEDDDNDDEDNNDYDYDSGDMEFTISGAGNSDKDFDRSDLNADATLGFYPMEYLEIFLRQGFTYADISGDDNLWAASSRGGFDIVFDLARLKPFIGGNIGYIYGSDEWLEDTWVAGPEAGLKFFATPSAFLYGLMEYQFLFEDGDEAEDQFDDGRFVYSIGVGFKF